jgi:hypothetical protein
MEFAEAMKSIHAISPSQSLSEDGIRFGPQTSEAFVSLWRQGLPGEVIVDTGPICAESGGKEQFLQGHAENIQA